MTKQIKTCDGCGIIIQDDVEGRSTGPINVVTGRTMDASGNGYDNDVTSTDLCLVCCVQTLNHLAHGMGKGETIAGIILSHAKKA